MESLLVTRACGKRRRGNGFVRSRSADQGVGVSGGTTAESAMSRRLSNGTQ